MNDLLERARHAAETLVGSDLIGGLSNNILTPSGRWAPQLPAVVAAETAAGDAGSVAEFLVGKTQSFRELATSMVGAERRTLAALAADDAASARLGEQLLADAQALASIEVQELAAATRWLSRAVSTLEEQLASLAASTSDESPFDE